MKNPLVSRFSRITSALFLCAAAAVATGCSASVDDPQSGDEAAVASDEALATRIVTSPEHPDASCEKNILGNMICTECTQGPFPSCKTYVCDASGNNCKQSSRVIRDLGTRLPSSAGKLQP